MDHLWSPWRYQYIQAAQPASGCIFCDKAAARQDEENLIVHRAEYNFLILNLYPYTTGHLMIAPFEHVATLGDASQASLQEMILLARDAEKHLRSIYHPDGFNIGMNIGESAGAGVAGHIHMHVLPRWKGDANFVSTIGETRVMPEDLKATWRKLTGAFAQP
ncbi:MAG: HIT family protein [Bryobacteraceae bacterium]